MPDKPPKLSVLARRLLSAVREIGKAIQDQKEAITVAVTEAAKTTNEKKDVPPLVRAEANLPKGVEIRKSAADTTKDQDYQSHTLLVSWLTFVVTFLTLISLIVYAFISAHQLREMRTANGISSEALESVQRAFIFYSSEIKPFYITDKEGSTKIVSWAFLVPIKNSGSTPAKNFKDHIFVDWLPQAIASGFNFHDFESGEPGVANPQDTIFYQTNPVPSDILADTKVSARHLYIYGWATYNDVFKGTPQRVTKFCYEMHAISGDFSNTNGPFATRTALCSIHNCADEDCKAN